MYRNGLGGCLWKGWEREEDFSTYLYFFCLCYHPSTINFISLTSLCFHLLAWSNSDLTLSLHTPTLQLLYCFLCLLICFLSSFLPSNLLFIFCLIICSHFTIHLPFPLLNSNIFVYVYRSIHVFWSSHFSQISFLSDVLWSVLFYLIITFAKIPLVNFPLFPFLTAFSCCLSIVLLFLGTILLISFTISFLPFLLLFL